MSASCKLTGKTSILILKHSFRGIRIVELLPSTSLAEPERKGQLQDQDLLFSTYV